jgi:alanine dehydrogenase
MYIIGIPKEIKEFERRVSIVPNEIRRLLKDYNDNNENNYNNDTKEELLIYVQADAGQGAGYSNADYIKCGAIILDTIEDIYNKADIIVKVKEPQKKEYSLITSKHTILSFFHFAGNKDLIEAMYDSKAKCYAYETIQDDNGVFPILSPMSIIAGKKSMIEADKFINKGKSPKGSSINKYAIITIIGVGNVGKAAAEQAILLGYENINLIDNNYEKIKSIEQSNPNIYKTYEMNDKNLKKLLLFSNIVISSIYNNGMKASKIITNDLLELMSNNTCYSRSSHNRPIIMDVAIDQGGTTDQSLPTTLEKPIIQYKNTHIYCVPNIPSTEPTEASIKLSNAVYPYLRSLVLVNADNANDKYLRELDRALYINN